MCVYFLYRSGPNGMLKSENQTIPLSDITLWDNNSAEGAR